MKQKIFAGLGFVVILMAMAIGGVFGGMFGDSISQSLVADKGSTDISISPANMPTQHVGRLTFKYTTPFLLDEAESKRMLSVLPINIRNRILSLEVYTSKPTCGIKVVQLLVAVYNSNISVNIDGAASGIVQKISALEGISNPQDSIVSTTISGYSARRISYKAERWNGIIKGEFLVVADKKTNTLWQLQFMFGGKKPIDHKKLKNTHICANHILASVSLMGKLTNDNFHIAKNGVTIKCPEANIADQGTVNGVTYTKRTKNQITPTNAATTCTSGITDMSGLFRGKKYFNENISSWDVSNVTNMSNMFTGASSFNQPIGSWNVSNVTNMNYMFSEAISFNQSIGMWDVSNVTGMTLMFYGAKSFNQPIGNWDVRNVKNMGAMFMGAEAFNQSIGSWNVNNVTNIVYICCGDDSFDLPTSKDGFIILSDMERMFYNSLSFNQDISSWCVTKIDKKPEYFSVGSPLTKAYMPVWGTCQAEER